MNTLGYFAFICSIALSAIPKAVAYTKYFSQIISSGTSFSLSFEKSFMYSTKPFHSAFSSEPSCVNTAILSFIFPLNFIAHVTTKINGVNPSIYHNKFA